MDIRVLRYFLAVADHKSISAASEALFLTQPTLSRQMMELEQELGVRLFQRGSKGKKLSLTEEGRLLKKRAEEILILVEKTESELKSTDQVLTGDIYIGAGESQVFSYIARAMSQFSKAYPEVRLHLFSGNGDAVLEKLESGVLDFGLIIGSLDLAGYDSLAFPEGDRWGLLVNSEHPLAQKSVIHPDDLETLPLIISEQSRANEAFRGWLNRDLESLPIVCRYNLLYNASHLAAENMGGVLCLDGLISACLRQDVTFIPLDPPLFSFLRFVWRSSRTLSRPAAVFLEYLRNELSGKGQVMPERYRSI